MSATESTGERPRLQQGDLLPEILVEPPGPASRALAQRLAAAEAPGINTLYRGRPGVVWREALGANVLDVDGNLYVDLTAGFGVAALGHRPEPIIAAAERQARRLLHGLGDAAAHEVRVELAERLVELAPVDDAIVHFAVSGADAVEIALKTMLLARPGRDRVLVFEPSYHGLTLGALAASSRPLFRQPFAAHLHERIVRRPFALPIADLEEVLADPHLAGVMLEPIVGREGVLVPPAGWLAELIEAARRHGVLVAVDEIFTGFGRVGSLWAVDADGARPDLVCCGKALGGGYPIAAVLGRRTVLDAWASPGEALHTATFVAHPVACAAALAALEALTTPQAAPAGDDPQEAATPIERAQHLGRALAQRFERWVDRHAVVSDVRGRGMLWGIELLEARVAAELVDRCRARGVLLLAGGPEGRVAQLAPSLLITHAQLDFALRVLESVLADLDELHRLVPFRGPSDRPADPRSHGG
ncbi:MAG: aspartate aminotransferase family protein [Acidobacteriota bacterium]